MALPTVYNVGTVDAQTQAATPGLPASPQAGDLEIMFLETQNQAITVENWTEAGSSPVSETNDVTRLTVFYRWWQNGDAAQVTSDSGNHQIGRIVGIRGAFPPAGNPFEATTGIADTTSSTGASIPGVTTSGNDRLIITACGVGTDTSTTANFSAWTNAALSNLTERCDNVTSTGSGGGFGVATGGLTSPGSSGNTTVTLANAARKTYWTAAILPLAEDKTLNDGGSCGELEGAPLSVAAPVKTAYASAASPRDLTQLTVATGDVVMVLGTTGNYDPAHVITGIAKQAGTATIANANMRQQRADANECETVLWTCDVTAGGTLTLRVTWAGTFTVTSNWCVYVATDCTGVGNTNSALAGGSSGTVSASLTTSEHSYVAMLAGDWSAGGGTTTTLTPANAVLDVHETDGVTDQSSNGSQYSARGGHWTDVGGGAGTYGVTAPSSQTNGKYNMVVGELLGGVSAFAGADMLSVDTSGATGITLADGGTGADTASVAAAVTIGDGGTAVTLLSVAAASTLADTGAGADSLAVALATPLVSTGVGADSLTVVAAALLADTATGADTLPVAVPVTVNESPQDYLGLPGTVGNYASSPDTPAVSVTGDIDIRVRAALNDWTPAADNDLISKWANGQRSWLLYVPGDGKPVFAGSFNGSTTGFSVQCTAATAVTDGTPKWVRVTRVSSTGVIKFWLSDDGSSWSQLGTDGSSTAGDFYDSSAEIEIGTNNNHAEDPLAGKVYRAQILNGIDGTVAFDANFASPGRVFSESSANQALVTIYGAGATSAGSCSDSLTVDKVSETADKALNDIGTGADTVSVTAAAPIGDIGAGTDSLIYVVGITIGDTASGVDTLSVAVAATVNDIGGAADSVTTGHIFSDVGGGADNLISAAATQITDNGAAADSFTYVVGVILGDTAGGVDTSSAAVAATFGDTGGGSDSIASTAAVVLTDIGAGSEAFHGGIDVTLADTAGGADSLTAAAAVPVADTGGGIDTVVIAAAAPFADTAAGTDTFVHDVGIAAIDTGSGVDSLSIVAAATLGDAGGGADSVSATGSVTITDTATGVDTIAVTGSGVATLADTAGGVDTVNVTAAAPATDTAASADSLAVAVTTAPVTDTAAGADSLSVEKTTVEFAKTLPDTGAATDTTAVTATAPAGDTAVGSDTATVSAAVPTTDTGAATDTAIASATAPIADGGSAVDGFSAAAAVVLSDVGVAADTGQITAAVTLADTAAGIDTFLGAPSTYTLADAGSGVDTAGVAAGVPTSDTGSGADTITVAAAITVGDGGSGVSTVATGVWPALGDVGQASDVLVVTAAAPLVDAAQGVDTTAVTAATTVTDTGAATTDYTVTHTLTDTGAGSDSSSTAAAVSVTDTGTGAETIRIAGSGGIFADGGVGVDTLTVVRPPGIVTLYVSTIGALTMSADRIGNVSATLNNSPAISSPPAEPLSKITAKVMAQGNVTAKVT